MWPLYEADTLKVLLLLMKNRTSYKNWNIETKYINIGVHSSWAQYIRREPVYKPIWSLFEQLSAPSRGQKR